MEMLSHLAQVFGQMQSVEKRCKLSSNITEEDTAREAHLEKGKSGRSWMHMLGSALEQSVQ